MTTAQTLPLLEVGLVGESGCGKSTLGRLAAGLLTPSEGGVLIDGVRRTDMSSRQTHTAWLKIQMIFQEPYLRQFKPAFACRRNHR